jgi:adenosylcobyric acid synthase
VHGGLLVCGTASDVGKSLISAGICRWLARAGVAVAPFKAQNMALNSAVTPSGAEIGRAQAVQAAACRVAPEAAMNPVLLKPSGDRHSQVVVMGRPFADAGALDYHALKPALREAVRAALETLRTRFDVVVCEGAGSPAEINLRAHDLANMGLARAAGLPVLLVGDIDRGGVFAALYGTLALLEPADQALVAGWVINKFRGDERILAPGIRQLEDLTGRPCLGVLPHEDGMWLDAEDSFGVQAGRAPLPAVGRDTLEVAVVRLRWMSNFTDVDALCSEPGVHVTFTRSPTDVERADLVVLPGTKATVEDLDRLRAAGLDVALTRRAAAGQPILGVCGGYQMLGDLIDDPVESRRGPVAGLGLLPVRTAFEHEKLLRQVSGRCPRAGGATATGYEIRHGRPVRTGGEPLIDDGTPEGEGCVHDAILGTSWHGLLEGDDLRRSLLGWVAAARGRAWEPGTGSFAAAREAHLDRLGDLVERHLDLDALTRLIGHGAPDDLPVLAPAGAAA